MAPARKIRVPVNTHAKGESFKDEMERIGRYMIGVSLISLKTIGRYDIDRTNEFFFKVDGDKIFRTRVPSKGNIKLRENQVFKSKSDSFTLWSEFKTFRQDQERILKLTLQLKEFDPGLNKLLGEMEIEIKCPSPTEYIILESKDGKTKAKLKVYAKKTLY